MEKLEVSKRARRSRPVSNDSVRDMLAPPPQYLPAVTLDERALVGVDDPMRTLIRSLTHQLLGDVVLPTLAAETRDELFRGLATRWARYHDTMSALVTLFRTTPAGVAFIKRAENDGGSPAADAGKIAGPSGADEMEFCQETYTSAMRITARFSGLSEARDLEEDGKLAGQFNFASSLFTLGNCMITAAASTAGHPTKAGIDAAFELLRKGALDAYVAARSALALRLPLEEDGDDSPLPLDDEDLALASMV